MFNPRNKKTKHMKNLLFHLVQSKANNGKFGSLLLSRMKAKDVVFVLCLWSFVFAPLSSIAQVPSYVPTSGLVGYWPFNGNANDESGNGNNGTVNGATLTTDRFGNANKAYSFDGVNDYVSCNPIIGIQEISVSIWLKKSGLGGHLVSQNIWNNPQSVSFASAYEKSTNNFSVGVNSGNCNFVGSQSFTGVFYNLDANWHHRVITINNLGFIRDYLDGQLINSATISNFQWCNSASAILKFGAWWNSDMQSWDGKLDDVSIYNRTLTQQEITNLYTSSVPPTITTTASSSLINCGESSTLTASSSAQPCTKTDLPATLQNGLVGYWPFCGNANDASGNGYNGTVNGATLTTDRFGVANKAYSFDGNGLQNITTNYPGILGQNDRSISLWFQYNTIEGCLLSYGLTTIGGRMNLYLYPSTGGSYVTIDNSNSQLAYLPFLPTGSWNHLVITYSPTFGNNTSSFKMYVNGVLCGSTFVNYNGNQPFNTQAGQTVRFGPDQPGQIGKMDDIAIWNRALNTTEIQQLYNIGTSVSYSWSTGATTPSITVSPAQTTSYSVTATNSAGSTTSSVTVNVADSLTWTGLYDTDWHKPCNWSPQFVPKCCNNVAVPFTTNQPIVSGIAAAEDLTIFTTNGAQVTVNNGANLQIADCPTAVTTTACPSLAVLTTTAVSSITQTSAISGGTISYQGANAITARGVCWGTSTNPTLANSFTTNGTGTGAFTSNLTGLVGGTTYYVRAYATNSSGTSYGNQLTFVAVNPQPAYPVGSVFCASGPTLVVDVTNPTTGKTWMDRNLGASQAATSATDAAAYGDLYQWGRATDGHQCRTSATTTTLSATNQPGHGNFILIGVAPNDWRSPQNGNLWQGINGVNNPCPVGYRVPTSTEFNAERASWSTDNATGAFGSVLKFTRSGRRVQNSGVIGLAGNYGFMWSSTVSGISSIRLNYSSGPSELVAPDGRAGGESVRCIKN
jgi:uncharacterized protein (TIGR02145 family)